ncbi:hypothetical protein FIBSPDRAFT_1049274, partial [Athelia psychrophila]
ACGLSFGSCNGRWCISTACVEKCRPFKRRYSRTPALLSTHGHLWSFRKHSLVPDNPPVLTLPSSSDPSSSLTPAGDLSSPAQSNAASRHATSASSHTLCDDAPTSTSSTGAR